MSVLIPDLKVYNYIHSGITTAAYRSQCDSFYSHSMRNHFRNKDIEIESERLLRSWIDLNEKSYNGRYSELSEKPLSTFWKRSYTYKELTATQLLKHIQCIIYNIELDYAAPTEQEKKDYELLKKWEIDLMSAIVSQTDEYKNANWSEAA